MGPKRKVPKTKRTPKPKAKEEPLKGECTICFEDYNKEYGVLKCKHAYCFKCIQNWAEKENTCPLCKSRFSFITKFEVKPKKEKAENSMTSRKRRKISQASSSSAMNPDDEETTDELEIDENEGEKDGSEEAFEVKKTRVTVKKKSQTQQYGGFTGMPLFHPYAFLAALNHAPYNFPAMNDDPYDEDEDPDYVEGQDEDDDMADLFRFLHREEDDDDAFFGLASGIRMGSSAQRAILLDLDDDELIDNTTPSNDRSNSSPEIIDLTEENLNTLVTSSSRTQTTIINIDDDHEESEIIHGQSTSSSQQINEQLDEDEDEMPRKRRRRGNERLLDLE